MRQKAIDSSEIKGKLVDLQILRALAASLVVIDHTFGALLYRKLPYEHYVAAADRLGGLGVATFFILSGLLMVRQTRGKFGERQSWKLFAWRRVTRIVPLYWLATLVEMQGITRWGGQLNRPGLQVLCSFLFIPNIFSGQFRLNPLLGPGWTLNYEMAFYLLFTLALLFSRTVGLGLLLTTLVCAALVHGRLPLEQSGPVLLAQFYTEPVILLFAAGVVLGLLEQRTSFRRPLWLRVSPAFLLGLPVIPLMIYPVARGARTHESMWYYGLSAFGFVVVWLCSLTHGDRSDLIERGCALFGDASYATYLFHLFVYASAIPCATWLMTHFHRDHHAVALYLGVSVISANLFGLAIHLAIERPMMRGLQRRAGSRLAVTQPAIILEPYAAKGPAKQP